MNSHESAERLVSAQNQITEWRKKAWNIVRDLPQEYEDAYVKNENKYIALLFEAALASDEEIANGNAIADRVKDGYIEINNSYLPNQVAAFKTNIMVTNSSADSIPLFYAARILLGEVTLREKEGRRQEEGLRAEKQNILKANIDNQKAYIRSRKGELDSFESQYKKRSIKRNVKKSLGIIFCTSLGWFFLVSMATIDPSVPVGTSGWMWLGVIVACILTFSGIGMLLNLRDDRYVWGMDKQRLDDQKAQIADLEKHLYELTTQLSDSESYMSDTQGKLAQ